MVRNRYRQTAQSKSGLKSGARKGSRIKEGLPAARQRVLMGRKKVPYVNPLRHHPRVRRCDQLKALRLKLGMTRRTYDRYWGLLKKGHTEGEASNVAQYEHRVRNGYSLGRRLPLMMLDFSEVEKRVMAHCADG